MSVLAAAWEGIWCCPGAGRGNMRGWRPWLAHAGAGSLIALTHPLPLAMFVPARLQAMEARRKERERPWLRLLAITTAASAVLLAAVLWRLEHMP